MVGEFKDDQLQTHIHDLSSLDGSINFPETSQQSSGGTGKIVVSSGVAFTNLVARYMGDSRNGTVTRGKRKGVNFIIKVL